MTERWKTLSLAVLVVISIAAGWLVYHETRVPQNEAEVNERVFELQKEHRYAKAVQVCQAWMTDPRYDSSEDVFFFHQIAMTYFIKAYERPAFRNESIQASANNLEKSLEAFDKRKTQGIQLDVYEIGRVYEELGKLTSQSNARAAYIRQLPMIEGESYTAYGHTTRPPVWAEIARHLDSVKLDLSQARCPTEAENQ
ncbi:MAG TPA: hypothetical protein VKD70_14300 [Candidatus Acidoferrum sp.]|nr:hypothetical protein [Candidatus Acidoferrum sp.]